MEDNDPLILHNHHRGCWRPGWRPGDASSITNMRQEQVHGWWKFYNPTTTMYKRVPTNVLQSDVPQSLCSPVHSFPVPMFPDHIFPSNYIPQSLSSPTMYALCFPVFMFPSPFSLPVPMFSRRFLPSLIFLRSGLPSLCFPNDIPTSLCSPYPIFPRHVFPMTDVQQNRFLTVCSPKMFPSPYVPGSQCSLELFSSPIFPQRYSPLPLFPGSDFQSPNVPKNGFAIHSFAFYIFCTHSRIIAVFAYVVLSVIRL